MRKLKRLAAFLLAVCVAVSALGCGPSGTKESAVYNMLPYIISLVVLALFSKNSRAPKAEGIPYDKGQR